MRPAGSGLLCLLFLTVPLFALSVGPELPLAPAVIEPAPFLRDTARVASNGDGFLAVWYDVAVSTGVVRAARLDRDGALLDEPAILVASNTGRGISVASDGADYLIAYDCTTLQLGGICIDHVDADSGAVRNTARIDAAMEGTLASDGDGYLLAYRTSRRTRGFPDTIEAVGLNDEGAVAGAAFRVAGSSYAAAIASNGEAYYVVYSAYAHLGGVLINEHGLLTEHEKLTPEMPVPAAFGWAVASDGEGFLVAWQQNTGVTTGRYGSELRLLAVARDGTHAETKTVEVQHAWTPFAAWTGTNYEVAYSFNATPAVAPYPVDPATDVRTLSVSRDGTPLETRVLADTPQREAAGGVAFNGVSTLFVWEHLYRPRGAQIEGVLQRNGSLDPVEIVLSKDYATQESVTAAPMREGVSAAWVENRGPAQTRKVFVERHHGFDDTMIAVGPSVRDQLRPALGGSAIAWIEEDETSAFVLVRLFDALGNLRPPLTLGPAARGSHVAVAAAGATQVVVWESPELEIVAVRIAASTGVLDVKPLRLSGSGIATTPVVASDGRDFFVAWRVETYGEACGVCLAMYDLYAAVLDGEGGVVRPSFLVSRAETSEPAVAWSGSEYLLVWSRWNWEDPNDSGAVAQRFSRAGNVVGSRVVLSRSGVPTSVAWAGSEWLIAVANADEMRVLRMSEELAPLQTYPITSRLVPETRPVVVAENESRAVVTYQVRSVRNPLASRAVARWFFESGNPQRRRAVSRR